MESTGKYWIPIYNILEDTCNITLANPKFIKKIRGHKRAIIAISRMLLTCCYNMLLNNEEFNSSLYDSYLSDCIKPGKTIDKMIKYLQSQCFAVQSQVKEPVGVTS